MGFAKKGLAGLHILIISILHKLGVYILDIHVGFVFIVTLIADE